MSWLRKGTIGLALGGGALLMARKKNKVPKTHGVSRKLWMVNHYAVTPDMPGGTRHLDLGLYLRDHGWETVIFASAFNHNSHKRVRQGRWPWSNVTECVNGVTFEWLPSTPYTRNNWQRYLNMAMFTANFLVTMPFRTRPDLILGSSAHLIAALGAWIASRIYSVPFVLEIRDVWPDSLIQLGLDNKLVIVVLRAIERFLYHEAVNVISVSEGIADRIAAKGVDRKKITVVPHGLIDTPPPTQAERDKARLERGWDDKIVAIWAGSLQPFNGLDTLIDAARELQVEKSLLICLIGDGSERDDLILRAQGLSNIQFHDSVSKDEIRGWLVAADIGVLTARKFDAFTGTRPRKIFDYMAAGLPIVCTIPGEAKRIIQNAQAGIFAEWENSNALADCLRDLAGDPGQRTKLGNNGLNSVRTDHSISTSAHEMARLLANAMGQEST